MACGNSQSLHHNYSHNGREPRHAWYSGLYGYGHSSALLPVFLTVFNTFFWSAQPITVTFCILMSISTSSTPDDTIRLKPIGMNLNLAHYNDKCLKSTNIKLAYTLFYNFFHRKKRIGSIELLNYM